MQLLAAVAALRAEHVAGEALGVHAAQHVAPVAQIALHQGHVLFARDVVHEAVRLERAVLAGQLHASLLVHVVVMRAAPVLQLFDGDDDQVVLARKLEQLARAHHGAVLAHDLAAQAALLHAGMAHEVDGGLGVAVALEHAAGLCHQREHMAGAAEVAGLGIVVHALERGDGAFRRRDARGGAHVVDAHGEGGLVVVGVLGDHLLKAELVRQVAAHRHADEALGHAGHQVDVGLGGELGGADHVAFVFAVGVVHHDDDVAGTQLVERLGDGVHAHRRVLSVGVSG